MLRYYITDRSQFPSTHDLLHCIARQIAAGIEMIQLRERDLPARELLSLAECVLQIENPHGSKLLINDRIDVALASGAAGVHLRGNSIAPSRIYAITSPGFVIGVSCHSVDEVRRAADEGATFAVLAPVYETPGKGPAVGLAMLQEAAHAVHIPVLALGRITVQRVPECLEAGAAGIAGISLFQRSLDLPNLEPRCIS